MWGLTPAERRALLLLAALYLGGALWDLWQARSAAPTLEAAAPRPPEPSATGSGGGAPAQSLARVPPLQLNRVAEAELDRLPGIGPVLAARIVAHRRAHGAFRSVDELAAVRGIGPALLERVRPLVAADSL